MTALLTFTSLRSSAPPRTYVHAHPLTRTSLPASLGTLYATPQTYPLSPLNSPSARSPWPSSTAAADLILRRSKVIEETIFKSFNSTTSNDYRQKIRSLYMNLADTKNPDLREAVVSGEIKAERLGTMTSQVSLSFALVSNFFFSILDFAPLNS
jgi:hypothetical protein